MPRPQRAIVFLVGLAVLAGLPAWTAPATAQERFSTAPQSSRWGKDYLPNLPVVDQDGKQYRFYDDLISGKNVVINFIFTTCTDICPLTTARMTVIQEQLGDAVGRDIFMYSITIDPENDKPPQLKQFAEAFRIGPGWRLLTGKPEDIAIIRHKLGERSRIKSEHRHEMLLGDSASGNWSRDSAFGDIARVVMNIRSLDPNWRHVPPDNIVAAVADTGHLVPDQPGQALFQKACASCHNIGKGDRIGPDLKGVSARRDRQWLTEFISQPAKVFARKDPIAMALAEKFRGVRMPNLGLSEDDARDVIAYLDAQSYIQSVAEASGGAHDHNHHHHHK